MMAFAVLLLLGAGAAGYWGVSLSQQPKPVAAPEPVAVAEPSVSTEFVKKVVSETRQDVVVLARDVAANARITEDDIAIEALRIAPPGSFAQVDAVLGRSLWRDIPAGTVLNEASFEVGGPLARMIRKDERALAIKIDEIVGTGGHLYPGDYVDALLFLREDEKNADRTVQMAVPALRVLSVGADLGLDRSGQPVTQLQTNDDNKSGQTGNKVARSAVLAVPEELVTRFMLAAQAGVLRLAVRSADEKRLEAYYEGESTTVTEINRQLYQFEKLALRGEQRHQPGLVSSHPQGIQVFRGSAVSHEKP